MHGEIKVIVDREEPEHASNIPAGFVAYWSVREVRGPDQRPRLPAWREEEASLRKRATRGARRSGHQLRLLAALGVTIELGMQVSLSAKNRPTVIAPRRQT